jgi:hypothetical protein
VLAHSFDAALALHAQQKASHKVVVLALVSHVGHAFARLEAH